MRAKLSLMNDGLYATCRELRRMFPALLMSICIIAARRYGWLPGTDPFMVMLHRIALCTLGFIAAHIVRQPAFPYLDLEQTLKSKNAGEAVGSAVLVGMIYLAFILGCALGF